MTIDRTSNCLACGTDMNLTDHHVVGKTFLRRYGRSLAKNVVTLCRKCHDHFERDFTKHKREFFQALGIEDGSSKALSRKVPFDEFVEMSATFFATWLRCNGLSEAQLTRLRRATITRKRLVRRLARECNAKFGMHPNKTRKGAEPK